MNTSRSIARVRLTIIGGGGFRVPLVYGAALANGVVPRVTDVCLYDTSSTRLQTIAAVVAQLAGGSPDAPTLTVTTDLDEALDGCDFVFSAMRVGGLEGRVADERVALDHGVLGQETTGPGGLVYGMRTLPVMLALAERIAERAPDAWLINFTNPAGMITEALTGVLGARVIGICDSPMGLARRACRALGVGAGFDRATIDYVGLNHLGWLHGVDVDGRDLLPRLLADERALAATEEGQLFGTEWIRTLGSIPNEYLYYYYFTRDAIASISSSAQTRAEYLLLQQADFYRAVDAAPGTALETWNHVRRQRNETYMRDAKSGTAERHDDDVESGGYEGVAVALMGALGGGPPATLILNVANRGTVPALPDDAVIEVPCRVDAGGPTPLPVTSPVGAALGLVQHVKGVERLAIDAAGRRSPDLAVKALALHPLVDSVNVARMLFSEYRRRIPSLDSVFSGGRPDVK